jgi:hypothetical protein
MCLAFAACAVAPIHSEALAQPLAVFGVDYTAQTLEGNLQRFTETGLYLGKQSLPETHYGLSLATDGTSLFVEEFGGAINRYSLDGVFLGEFADVHQEAGDHRTPPNLETDLAGNVYSAFRGFASEPRKSFRMDNDGNVTGAFQHDDLIFPNGIDATSNGDVYILNSAFVGVGERLFRFSADGQYIADYPLAGMENSSDMAINEATNELYIADEFGYAVNVYDLSSGAPALVDQLSTPRSPTDVFVEPTSGRIFGTFFEVLSNGQEFYESNAGFEISRAGDLITTYLDGPPTGRHAIRSIVAIPIPELHSVSLAIIGVWSLMAIAPPRST